MIQILKIAKQISNNSRSALYLFFFFTTVATILEVFSIGIILPLIQSLMNGNENFSLIIKETKSYSFQFEIDFGIDSLTIIFLSLASFLISLIIWIVISTLLTHQFYIIILYLIGFHLYFTFFSLNTILFLIGFEVILVFMYFLISNWGSKLYKIRSSFYLLLFTIFGSLFLFITIIILLIITGSTNFILLENFNLLQNQQISLSFCFIIGFGMKVPIFPFHIW